MRRRALLTTGAAAAAGLLAGCLAGGSDPFSVPPALDDPPDGVYRPTFGGGTRTVGTATVGQYGVALLYSYPSRFWELTGTATYERSVTEEDEVHLMATAWDAETGVVLPEAGVTVEVTAGGDLVSQEVVYSMVSQRLGFHYGDNFVLDGEGDYQVTVSVGGTQVRRTGGFEGRLDEAASATFDFRYRRDERDEIPARRYDDAGEPGAVEPADTSVPRLFAPEESSLPGTVVGSATADDAVVVATRLTGEEATRFGARAYLAVFAHTPYNRMLLPMAGIRARVERDGGTAFEDTLTRTLDPELAYHYGAPVDLRAGDELTLEAFTPPQVARHEGYETAFVDMPARTLTV
jgi:hypothetical protein